MKALVGGLKERGKGLMERYQKAVAAQKGEPEVRPYINWQGIRDGALGYECKTDAEIMRNVGSVNRYRLAEVIRQKTRKAWMVAIPLAVVLGYAGYAGFKAAHQRPGAIEIKPLGDLFAAREVLKEEIASLQSSIRSAMTARIAGDYAKVIQDGIFTRYPNWALPDLTQNDLDGVVNLTPENQQAFAIRCKQKVSNGSTCSAQESILYRYLNFDDKKDSLLLGGADLVAKYLANEKFADICQAQQSEKAFFNSLTLQQAIELVAKTKRAWLEGDAPKLADGYTKASGASDLAKSSTAKGCDLQPAMSLVADKGPFKQLLQVYYRPQGKLAVEGVWIGLAEEGGRRQARLMGCSTENCSNSFGLDQMDYSHSPKAFEFLTSIATAEGK